MVEVLGERTGHEGIHARAGAGEELMDQRDGV
jgi:hypothetical protein